ncbi:MAG: VWA domain-containing protein [Planctomycetes bacterium]|nr:VWA domain-containing protein [Planctomycetota bacterium]
MGFLHPEFLLLALPAALLGWRWRGAERGTQLLRAATLALLVLAAAAPYLRTGDDGRDLVIVVDRSRSMPGGSAERVAETIALAEEARAAGDRVAVVAFGADVGIETAPQATARFAQFVRALDGDGSNLGDALDTALALIPKDRGGSILLLSDGEANGREPLSLARAAFARGVRIDTVPVLRESGADVAVERLDLPEEVGAAEPFQFSAWVRADEQRTLEFVLERDGVELARGMRTLARGANRLSFRDVLGRAGAAQYRLALLGAGDRRPENDTGVAAVRVTGQRPVLVVNDDGAEDTLTRALRQAGIPLEVTAPEGGRLTRLGLTGVRAVVLENVAAQRVGAQAMAGLAEFVRERGGGLLMTGGRASFGIGGYHLSALDGLLPVSMEMRQETRKIGVAMAIALDRSGSMAVEAAPGVPKMQLANLGTCAAIELLSPIDAVGVIAVDSAPHTVQGLTRVDDIQAITARVRTIESSGGGIYCYSALLAAGKMLEDAAHQNRHIILFADAADSEEQERCPELIERLRTMGITLSVVALGTEQDSDAAFLKRIAELGAGQCYFTHDPAELPRLFAQDTLTIARATFVDEPVACTPLPDLFGLGETLDTQGFPELGGYNVTWLEPEATCGVVTQSEFKSPAFAFAQMGLGRTAAFSGQIGGDYGGALVAWDGFAPFFVTVVRWLAGQEEPGELFASARREGRTATIRVEVDPRASAPPDTSALEVRLTGADGKTTSLPLERVGEHLYEATTTLAREGVVLGSVSLGDGRALALPPLLLPYSPEFEVGADPERGAKLLRQLARESGGEVAPPLGTVFRGERAARVWRVVAREFALAALVLFVLEIALRRLQLWGSLARVIVPLRGFLRRRQAQAVPAPVPSAPLPFARAPATLPPSERAPAEPAAAAPPRTVTSLDDALTRARRAADRELER